MDGFINEPIMAENTVTAVAEKYLLKQILGNPYPMSVLSVFTSWPSLERYRKSWFQVSAWDLLVDSGYIAISFLIWFLGYVVVISF